MFEAISFPFIPSPIWGFLLARKKAPSLSSLVDGLHPPFPKKGLPFPLFRFWKGESSEKFSDHKKVGLKQKAISTSPLSLFPSERKKGKLVIWSGSLSSLYDEQGYFTSFPNIYRK